MNFVIFFGFFLLIGKQVSAKISKVQFTGEDGVYGGFDVVVALTKNYLNAGLFVFKNSSFQSWKLQKFQSFNVLSFKVSKFQSFKVLSFKVPKFQCFTVSQFQSSKIQIKISKFGISDFLKKSVKFQCYNGSHKFLIS